MALTAEGTSKFVTAGGNRIHYHEAGPAKGPVVMMLHGGGPGAGAWSNFRRNIDAFAEHYRVVMPDFLGFSKSDKPKFQGELFKVLADSTRSVMDALGIERAHLIGNSLGGGTSIRLAIDTPKRVDRLVVMGPGGSLPLSTPVPSEGIKHLFNYYEGDGPSREKLDKFLDCMVYDRKMITEQLFNERYAASIQPELIANPVLSPRSQAVLAPLWQECERISNRTLLIWGRDDRTVLLDNAWIMLNRIPDVRLHVFGKTGHWAQWERAAEFNKLVLGFLAVEG